MVNTFISTISFLFDRDRLFGVALSMTTVMLLFLFVIPSAFASHVDVAIDRNPVSLTDDAFQLTFITAETPDSEPDFSPLEQDFTIIDEHKKTHMSWLNGTTSSTVQWTLSLIAKRSGDLQIPAVFFGADASQPLTITVSETTLSNILPTDNELFLEVEASPTNAYVQGQILYTARFYRRVNLTQAMLSDPELENAIIEKVSSDIQYNTKINGITYAVTERKYAIFPQQSGPMTIEPLDLTARVIIDDPRSRYNSFFNSQSTQIKHILSKPISLNIKAAPASFKGDHWLPAEQLTLKESWSSDTLEVKVGEPITRTLTIIAKGATSSQLPDLSIQPINAQVKVYPDQAVINDQQYIDGMIAVREQKMAFIPSTSGHFTLPAIEVPWFNTQTQKMETTQLPAVTLVAVVPESTNTSENSIPSSSTMQSGQLSTKTTATVSNNIWMWVSLGFILIWLFTLLFLFWSRVPKLGLTKKPKVKNKAIKSKEIVKELRKACTDNNPQAAQQALIKWAKVSYGITNLTELTAYCNVDMQAELTKLNHALYAKEKLTWNGSKLLQAVITARQTKLSVSKSVDEPLVPLYPSQG